jgi:hypothetical protein
MQADMGQEQLFEKQSNRARETGKEPKTGNII